MGDFIVMGAWNTKKQELDYICKELKKRSHKAIKLDLGTNIQSHDRGKVIDETIVKCREQLKEIVTNRPISGAISIGGGTGLYMGLSLMGDLPLFLPKVMISTMIANSLHVFESYKDIVYLQTPFDFAGALNPAVKGVLEVGTGILAAMHYKMPEFDRPAIAITSVGACFGYVEAADEFWTDKDFYLVPFHGTGEGTMAMAEMIREGYFAGVLDVSPHDIMDHIGGGDYGNITEDRVASYFSMDVPTIICPGGFESITGTNKRYDPDAPFFKGRKHVNHDFRWGAMSKKEEVIKATEWIGNIYKKTNPKNTKFLIPLDAWSYFGKKGGDYYDPEMNPAFINCLKTFVKEDSIVEVDMDINDPAFGTLASEHLYELIKNQPGGLWLSPLVMENVLLEHSHVSEAVVVTEGNESGLDKPVAFVVLKDGHKPTPDLEKEVSDFVRSRTNHAKYPQRINFVDELPRTVTGKVQRYKLRDKLTHETESQAVK
ncbi:Tm-1-like ATP-binding domain-containing protein [Desulfobacula sp.]|uniref:Tm-1-like ATP-binding domain-containing protein n=1 Tax=Desulfobacula sp. TaxID=2593537 RepID=UPI002632A67D|nr:Tm-1-like ATP-binding domain-containing protein [Desulfobacula sp.]